MSHIKGDTAQEIYDSIRGLVAEGRTRPGEVLPPVRELAEQLGVNRNTVAAAYQRLAKAGVVETRGRRGTMVCEPPRAGEQEGNSPGTPLIDMADGNPDPEWLPDPLLQLPKSMPRSYLYGDDIILPELRAFATEWFGPDCPSRFEIELTHGAVDAIERLATAHLVPGDRVAVEDPCFLGTINALRLAGVHARGVAMDEAGMRPDALAAVLEEGARAVLITPRAHNPTGCSLSRKRSAELRKVLAGYPNVLVLIDDHFALLATEPYHSVIPPSTMRWALIRSVSKALGPSLRLAFLACDPDTAERLSARLAPGTTWVSQVLQLAVAGCLRSKAVRQQLEAAKESYACRRDELCKALLAEGISVSGGMDGLNVWIPLPMNARDTAYALARAGWLVRPGSAFDIDERSQALRVTTARMKSGQARQFASLLGDIIA